MDDDHQPVAAPATRGRKASRVPGDTGGDQPAAAPARDADDFVEEGEGQRVSIPDFRHKSCAAAAKWVRENPDVPKRAILTAEGYYVHSKTFKTKVDKEE